MKLIKFYTLFTAMIFFQACSTKDTTPHAPKNTTVECRLEDGNIISLKVSPQTRSKDVIISENFQQSIKRVY